MKKATCEYTGVRAIAREEAITLAPEIFNDPSINLLRASGLLRKTGSRIFQEGVDSVDKFLAAREVVRSKGILYEAAGNTLWAGAGFLWAELARKHGGCIPRPSELYIVKTGDISLVMNFIAADLDNKVYSYIGMMGEIWIYHGMCGPDSDRVEKVEWRKG